jgi:hypothetical protein
VGFHRKRFISDPAMCRLYLGLSKLDLRPRTACARPIPTRTCGLTRTCWISSAACSSFADGKAVVPGGAALGGGLGRAGRRVAGARREFFDKLIAKDDGWLASLLRRAGAHQRPVQDYLTDPVRMKRFYAAVRGKRHQPRPGASRVPLQHRHDAAHHPSAAWMPMASRTFPAIWKCGRTCLPTTRKASTTAS